VFLLEREVDQQGVIDAWANTILRRALGSAEKADTVEQQARLLSVLEGLYQDVRRFQEVALDRDGVATFEPTASFDWRAWAPLLQEGTNTDTQGRAVTLLAALRVYQERHGSCPDSLSDLIFGPLEEIMPDTSGTPFETANCAIRSTSGEIDLAMPPLPALPDGTKRPGRGLRGIFEPPSSTQGGGPGVHAHRARPERPTGPPRQPPGRPPLGKR
jgi:hypothetical protein